MFGWTFIMRNGNKYLVETKEKNIEDLIKNNFQNTNNSSNDNIFSTFALIDKTNDEKNLVLIRYSEISEVLWTTR